MEVYEKGRATWTALKTRRLIPTKNTGVEPPLFYLKQKNLTINSLKAFLLSPTVQANNLHVLQTWRLLVLFVQPYLSHQSSTVESKSSCPVTHPCLTKDNPHRSAPALCLLICDNSCATKLSPTRFPLLCQKLCHQ